MIKAHRRFDSWKTKHFIENWGRRWGIFRERLCAGPQSSTNLRERGSPRLTEKLAKSSKRAFCLLELVTALILWCTWAAEPCEDQTVLILTLSSISCDSSSGIACHPILCANRAWIDTRTSWRKLSLLPLDEKVIIDCFIQIFAIKFGFQSHRFIKGTSQYFTSVLSVIAYTFLSTPNDLYILQQLIREQVEFYDQQNV